MTGDAAMPGEPRAEPDARRALIDAAKALLPERAPSTVTGRELAEAAGVNYGLVHHYFGSKDAALREAVLELRDEFLAAHPDLGFPDLLPGPEPFLRAIGLSQTDYPKALGEVDDFPAVDAMVDGVRRRLTAAGAAPTDAEARARAMAMLCLQLGWSLYSDLLLATVRATDDARVTSELAAVYRGIAGVADDA